MLGALQEKKPSNSAELLFLLTGDVLSSQGPAPQVLLALESLTAVFGMGTGVTSLPLSPDL
jgi:hypothetical protein